MFSLSLIFGSSNMIRLNVCCWLLSCWVFLELPGSMVWCLIWIWGNAQSLLLPIFLLFPCLSPPPDILIILMLHLLWLSHSSCIYSDLFTYLLPFLLVFCPVFSLESFYYPSFKLRDSFFSHVQSTDKPIKDILHFYCSVLFCLLSLAFLFISPLKFPSLCYIAHLLLYVV